MEEKKMMEAPENKSAVENVDFKEDSRQEMKRVLGVPSLVIQGLAWLCPACIVMYYGIINELTGGAFPLVLVFATIAMTMTAMSYAQMSKKYIRGGSVYIYAGGTFGPKTGFMTGWLLILDYFLMPMMCYLTSGLYLNILFPSISASVFTIATIVFVFICNYIGIKFATFVNMLNVVVPILLLLFTLIWICKFIINDIPTSEGTFLSLTAFMAPETISWDGVLQGTAIMCVVFVGFDVATTLAGETKEPKKTVPKAVIIIMIYTGISFILTAYLMNCGWTYEAGMLKDPNTAISEYYVYLGLSWMNIVFVPINTLACIGCCLAGNASSSRILYNMSQDRFLPKKFFGYVHPRFKTPSWNIALAAFTGFGALLFQGQVLSAANLVSFGALLAFIITNFCVIGAYWYKDKCRGSKAVLFYLLIPLLAGGIDIFLWAQLSWMSKLIGFSWVALGLIILALRTKGFKELPPEVNFEQ